MAEDDLDNPEPWVHQERKEPQERGDPTVTKAPLDPLGPPEHPAIADSLVREETMDPLVLQALPVRPYHVKQGGRGAISF